MNSLQNKAEQKILLWLSSADRSAFRNSRSAFCATSILFSFSPNGSDTANIGRRALVIKLLHASPGETWVYVILLWIELDSQQGSQTNVHAGMTSRKSKQESSNRLRDIKKWLKKITRINKYCSSLLAWQVLALMQNGFSNFDLKRIKPQALMVQSWHSDSTIIFAPTHHSCHSSLRICCWNWQLLGYKGEFAKSKVFHCFFVLSHVICHFLPRDIHETGDTSSIEGLYMRRSGLKIWTEISQCLERFEHSEVLFKYAQVPQFRFIRWLSFIGACQTK